MSEIAWNLTILLLWGIGHPFLLRYWRKQEDITLKIYIIILFIGFFGIGILAYDICEWFGKFKFPKIRIYNPIILKKNQVAEKEAKKNE